MENKIDCCDCESWDSAKEECTISELWEYEQDKFCEMCPQYQREENGVMKNDETRRKRL